MTRAAPREGHTHSIRMSYWANNRLSFKGEEAAYGKTHSAASSSYLCTLIQRHYRARTVAARFAWLTRGRRAAAEGCGGRENYARVHDKTPPWRCRLKQKPLVSLTLENLSRSIRAITIHLQQCGSLPAGIGTSSSGDITRAHAAAQQNTLPLWWHRVCVYCICVGER